RPAPMDVTAATDLEAEHVGCVDLSRDPDTIRPGRQREPGVPEQGRPGALLVRFAFTNERQVREQFGWRRSRQRVVDDANRPPTRIEGVKEGDARAILERR